MFHAWCRATINNDVLAAQIKHDKTLDCYENVIYFCVYSMRFTRFCVGLGNTVNCDTLAPQRKHEKTLWFYTDYQLFCILDAFLICFFDTLFDGKTCEFRPRKKAGKLHC